MWEWTWAWGGAYILMGCEMALRASEGGYVEGVPGGRRYLTKTRRAVRGSL